MKRLRFRLSTGPSTVAEPSDRIGDDLLRGAEAIAQSMVGDPGQGRKVYHLVQTGQLPVVKTGSTLCTRRSALLRWIERQEAHATGTCG